LPWVRLSETELKIEVNKSQSKFMDEDVKNLSLAFGGIILMIMLYLVINNWAYFSSDSFWQPTREFLNIKTYE
jgi:hypothetical protein